MKRILLIMLIIFGVVQAGITFTTGSKVYIGNATLDVYGNITNDLVKDGSEAKLATINYLSTSKIRFPGAANDTITNIYTFSNVVIDKPSGNVRLNNSTGNFLLTGNLDFSSGNILTGTSTFELGSTATVTGESASSYIVGTTKAVRSVGTGTNSFGGIGYSIDNTGSDLGTVTVYRYTGDGSEEVLYGSEGIWRKWDFQTSNTFSGTRQVTTSWLSNEDNGNVLSNLKVWKYDTSKKIDDDDVRPDVRKIKSAQRTVARNIETESRNDIAETDEDHILIEETPKTLGWVEVDSAAFNTSSSPRSATYTIDASTQYTINDVANAFADGAGTESNPYQIATLDQLNAVRYYTSACFIQVADIDATATSTWNSGAGWEPITSFAGKYNGDGHTISNLYVYRPGTSYVGLFGSTNTGSDIKDIGLDNADITGGTYTGSIVGWSTGSISGCYAKGSVSSDNNYAGGIVGYTRPGCTIDNTYSHIDVTRTSGATGTYFGGFCGRLYSASMTNCYSTGTVIYENATDPTANGLIGAVGSGNTYTANFWNIETSNQTSTAGTATGLTKNQMRTLSIFTDATWDFQDETANGTDDIWGISATENYGYPFLSWEGITHYPSPFAGGIGTSDEPFLVSDLAQLDAVRNFLSCEFLQTADIDASETSAWDGGAGWMPIGSTASRFTGHYDGGGNLITDLFVNRTTTDHVGFFGYIGSGSWIKNIGVKDADITGEDYVGGVVGYQYAGTIENCFSTGNIYGLTMLGGFAGYIYSNGNITNSYSGCVVTATSGTTAYIGGFAGRNYNSTVQKCYSTGSVHYAASTDPTSKGFIGTLGTSAVMSDNFWDTQSSGQTTSAGGSTGKTTSEMQDECTYTSLVTAGLTDPWDFVGNPNDDTGVNDIWNIHSSLNEGYPYLDWEYRIPVEAPANLAITVGSTDITITWDTVTGATEYAVYSSADPYGIFDLDLTGAFNGTEWTAPLPGTKMFYYVKALNGTKDTEDYVIKNRIYGHK